MIKQLWPTPFFQSSFSESIRESCAAKILSEYDLKAMPSDLVGENNILEDFPEFKEKVIYPAFDDFLKLTTDRSISDWPGYKFKAWLAGCGVGYNINFHNHSGAQLSAVFYMLCDENSTGGEITFTDPRMNSNRGYDDSFNHWFREHRIKPKNGDFVIFPSYLYHFVNTYSGSIRLAMPVDLFLHGE